MTKLRIVLLKSFLFIAIIVANDCKILAQNENLNVFNGWVEWSNGENMLSLFLNKQAYKHLDAREQEIYKLKTESDWIKRQQKVKETLMRIVNPFREKTDLKPRVTEIIQKEGLFNIEFRFVIQLSQEIKNTIDIFIKLPFIINLNGTEERYSPTEQNNIFLEIDA